MLKVVLVKARENAPMSLRQEMAARQSALRTQRALERFNAEFGWNHGDVVPSGDVAF